MAILKTFLCVCNTRTGSLISGCYTLAISLLCLVYFLFRYVGHKLIEESAEYKGIIYVGFVLYGFMIISSLVIIPGVQLDKRYLLLPWIYIVILVVLYDTGSVALLTTVHMEREKTLHVWEIVWLFFYLFRLAANCYCFTCVVSQYQELSDGRGTYDYLYKPRRRARMRNMSPFDIETFDLPFGVHLPPYTAEDNTENSPPSYSQIYPPERESSSTDSYQIQSRQSESGLYSNNCANDDYETIQVLESSAAVACVENCPYCALATQSSANYSYRRRNIRRFPERLREENSCPETDTTNLAQSQTVCPVLIHNENTEAWDPCGDNTQVNNMLFGQCNNINTRRFSNQRQCYEVTVNVEWI